MALASYWNEEENCQNHMGEAKVASTMEEKQGRASKGGIAWIALSAGVICFPVQTFLKARLLSIDTWEIGPFSLPSSVDCCF